MNFILLRKAWKTDCGTHTKKLLLVRLCDYADKNGISWPSIETLSKECNLSQRAVQNQLSALEAAGLISIERRGGRHMPNRYQILTENPAPDAPFQEKPRSRNTVSGTEKGASGSRKGARRSINPAPDAPQGLRRHKGSPNEDTHRNGEPVSAKPESLEKLNRIKDALSVAFKRKPEQPWAYCDLSMLAEVVRDRPDAEDELKELLAHKEKVGRYFPSLRNLLENWDGAVDRSRMPDASHNGKPVESVEQKMARQALAEAMAIRAREIEEQNADNNHPM